MDLVKVSRPKNRLNYLDGLRGVSILAVVLYHAYSLWGGFYWSSYDMEKFQQNSILQTLTSKGHMGVQLFFMISGFVIFMTLEKTKHVISFAYKRWARLFPLMLISGLMVLLTAPLLTYRPQGSITWGNFLGSLALTPESFFTETWHVAGSYVDGSWWSLVTEVFFYALAAISFYLLKDKKLYTITGLYITYAAATMYLQQANHGLIINVDITAVVLQILNILNAYHFSHFGWFIIGMVVYKYKQKQDAETATVKDTVFLITKTVLLVAILMVTNFEIPAPEFFPLVLAIFLAPLFSKTFVKLLTTKFVIFFGLISFPLYLIHQNIVTGLANQIYVWNPNIPVELLPVFPIVIVLVLSTVLYSIDLKIKPHVNNLAAKAGLLK